MRVIRKRYRVLLFAAIVAAIAVPVGFALSLEPSPVAAYSTTAVAPAAIVMPTLGVDSGTMDGVFASFPDIPDPLKLVIVGTTFLGLAAVVRKAT